MPFTFSHTAATLLFKPWLKEQKLSYTGLILGCMAPDFEYFLRMNMQGDMGHHFIGIFLVDVPLGLILAFLIHTVIRDPFIEYLPRFLKQRFIVFQNLNGLKYLLNNFWKVVVSLILGILTHILWDAFTHKSGFVVQLSPLLQQVIHFSQFNIPVFKILQYLSGVLGLLIVMICIYKLPKHPSPNCQNEQQHQLQRMILYWGMTLLCFIGLFGWKVQFDAISIQSLIHYLVVGIACLFWSILAVSLGFKVMKLKP
ncbi:MAG: DUF4184 family protein [Acinetobacter sp.]